MLKTPGVCPVCEGTLIVRSFLCTRCNVRIEGEFALPKILSLSEEQMELVLVFLRARGNIKEVERELGISYPTVRNRLEEVVAKLGYETQHYQAADVSEVLTSLESGDITFDQALRRLQGES